MSACFLVSGGKQHYDNSTAKTADPKSLKELIEADESASVFVDIADHLSHFGLGELQSVVVESLRQLFTIQRSATVVVHDTKRPEQYNNFRTPYKFLLARSLFVLPRDKLESGDGWFLLRDAMQAQYMLSSCVCPSVCPSQAGTVPKRLNLGSNEKLIN